MAPQKRDKFRVVAGAKIWATVVPREAVATVIDLNMRRLRGEAVGMYRSLVAAHGDPALAWEQVRDTLRSIADEAHAMAGEGRELYDACGAK
jgi:hypothetical protein